MTDSKRERILVAQTSFLGDVVLTTPLLSAIRRHFPQAVLSVLCTPQAKSLLESNPDLDEILIYEKGRDGKGTKQGIWSKAKELRSRSFTMAISPHKSLRTALLLFLAGIPRRIGFRQSAGWFLYHRRVNRDSTRHDVERNLSLLQGLSIDPTGISRNLRVEVDSESRDGVERLLSTLGIRQGQRIFGINPGSIWATKRWMPEAYAALMALLKEKYECQILLFGSAADREITDRVQCLSGNAGVNLAGKLDLRQLPAAIDWCDVFVSNDSGPMHIAVARGIPVVAVFCATTPSLGFYPYSARAVVIEKDLACRPCGSHGGRRCPLGTEACMRSIKAEDVFHAVERLLETTAETNSLSGDSYLPQSMLL